MSQGFLPLIEDKGLSPNILSTLGYFPREPMESPLREKHNSELSVIELFRNQRRWEPSS
jgi:hypothetical protein